MKLHKKLLIGSRPPVMWQPERALKPPTKLVNAPAKEFSYPSPSRPIQNENKTNLSNLLEFLEIKNFHPIFHREIIEILNWTLKLCNFFLPKSFTYKKDTYSLSFLRCLSVVRAWGRKRLTDSPTRQRPPELFLEIFLFFPPNCFLHFIFNPMTCDISYRSIKDLGEISHFFKKLVLALFNFINWFNSTLRYVSFNQLHLNHKLVDFLLSLKTMLFWKRKETQIF